MPVQSFKFFLQKEEKSSTSNQKEEHSSESRKVETSTDRKQVLCTGHPHCSRLQGRMCWRRTIRPCLDPALASHEIV